MSTECSLPPLDKFPLGQRLALPGHFVEPTTLEAVRFIGKGYECRVSLGDGTSDEAIITVDEEGRERQCFSPDDAEEGREHRHRLALFSLVQCSFYARQLRQPLL
jgi:hypothetical protein